MEGGTSEDMEAGMWGSDLIAEAIRLSGFRFAAINPGASYRGLHDSFVNHPPGLLDLITCLHEEHAVALAHGWTKVTDAPALAIVHSNVGALHAAMAVYNAWADRAPVVVLGAGGPMDAMRRRPWIEWIHTVQDQGAIFRPFTKWDDAPASAAAAARAVAQARFLAAQPPSGPVYVSLDVTDQEALLEGAPEAAALVTVPEVPPAGLTAAQAAALAGRLAAARRPVCVFGRLPRNPADWLARVALVEATGALAITDIRSPAAFPTDHPAHVGTPGFAPDAAQRAALSGADLVLLFDPIDPATLIGFACAAEAVLLSPDLPAHRGWVRDAQPLPFGGTLHPVPPAGVAAQLLAALEAAGHVPAQGRWQPLPGAGPGGDEAHSLPPPSAFARIAAGLERLRAEGQPIALTRLPLSWPGGLLPFRDPLDYLGRDGGEGLASGPGIAVGAALALKGSGRLPVAVLGDGDLMMGATALWTAANRRLPLLVVVAANGVYGNDVVHQERIARARGRDVENRWVGQCLTDPELDIAAIARGLGATAARRVAATERGLEDAVADLGRRAMAEQGLCLLEVAMPAA